MRASSQEKSGMDHHSRVQVVVARLVLPFEDIPRKDEATAGRNFSTKWTETT